MSAREMTRRCESRGWGSLGTTQELRHGELRPTMKAMAAIATALGVQPEVFAEYRLGKIRSELDPDIVGFKAAVRNLGRYEVVAQAADGEAKRPVAKGPRQAAGKGRRASK